MKCKMSNHAPFNYPCQRGVAAKAGCVHLIFSKDRKLLRLEGRGQTTLTATLKDPLSQSSVGWPPEVHQKPTSNPTKTTQRSQSQNAHNSITTVAPHHPRKSSPNFLCGRSNTTSSQPHPLHTFVAFPPALQSAQSHLVWGTRPFTGTPD